MSVKDIARRRIERAQEATRQIDHNLDLWQAIETLQRAGGPSNGAGIYADIPRLKSALAAAASAIARAQKIVNETEWPSDHDYDVA